MQIHCIKCTTYHSIIQHITTTQQIMNNKDFTSILSLIEQKFGRGSSANWKNRDFEDLNFEILKETKTNISAHTLKRIFGKIKTDEYYLPQKATILALKKFVNYTKNESTLPEITTSEITSDEQITTDIQTSPPKKVQSLIYVATLAVLLLVISGYYFFKNNNEDSIERAANITLISTEGRIPKSAEFEYTTPNNKDSFSICFDGNFTPLPVAGGIRKRASYYYQYPGFFKVRMWKNDKIISDITPVFVPTNGWEAFGMYHQQKQMQHFYPINVAKYTRDSIFCPNKSEIHGLGMDTSRLVEVRVENYKPTGIKDDNFTLETTLKNSNTWAGSTCNSVFLVVTGRKESIKLHFTNPGCSYWVRFRLSEKRLDNKNDKLSDFVFNLADWQKLRIENRNKQITIFVNNIKRYSNSYEQSIGEIMGVTVIFQGNGYLRSYRLSDIRGRDVFKFPEINSPEK